ncbi:MAG: hypothetical protein ABFS32_20210 [Bacteroidota bacterium]
MILASPANASPVYWNIFNLEGENSLDSVYITYDTPLDMLTDSNRTGSFTPNTVGLSAENVVGSGSDGSTYWNLFNLEGENSLDSVYITYDTLLDMLTDSNRIGSFTPNTVGLSAENVVGSGAFGMPTTTPVPTPAILPLLSIGLTGLVFALRSQKKAR